MIIKENRDLEVILQQHLDSLSHTFYIQSMQQHLMCCLEPVMAAYRPIAPRVVMWCSAFIGSVQQFYQNISKQILQGSTVQQGLAWWWERESQPQCYCRRACMYTLVKTLGYLYLTVILILLTFANRKISIRRKSDIANAIGNKIKMAAFYKILITWTSSRIL